MSKGYNGHKCWAYWNVALWIGNDEGLYNAACQNIRRYGKDAAARIFVKDMADCGITETPDGAKYSISAVREALKGL